MDSAFIHSLKYQFKKNVDFITIFGHCVMCNDLFLLADGVLQNMLWKNFGDTANTNLLKLGFKQLTAAIWKKVDSRNIF